MPTFGQQFLQGFTGTSSLRDYTHASKAFTTNAFELKPRYKFLFHVSFTLNSDIPAISKVIGTQEAQNLSVVVKTVDLPKYSIATETLNQYNRKRVVQTKINYEPVTLTFHDDSGDNVRNMWYNYYSYYYKDPSQNYLAPNSTNGSLGQSGNKSSGFGYNARDIYENQRLGNVNDWGYIGEAFNDGTSSASGKPPFFRDIRIYGMDQHKFAEYVLINPVITAFNHDQYSYAEGAGTMQNTMTIAYETVKYYSGAVGNQRPDINVQGFADPAHYDTTTSPISRPGSRGAIGAVQKAGTAYNTFKGKNIASIAKSEAVTQGVKSIQGAIPGAIRSIPGRSSGMYFPSPQSPSNNNTTGR